MLKAIISDTEIQMKGELNKIRSRFNHPGDKGTSTEVIFRTFLREYLPRRLEVGNGEVVDLNGQRSKQTDVIIVNEDHPITFTPDLPGLFFIEGVCAAGEVKVNLTSTELEKCLENSVQFKKLKMYLGKGTMAASNPSDLNRFYKCPPWFLFAFESQLTLSSIHKKIIEFEKKMENKIEPNKLMDAVFILNRGWIINMGDGKGSYQFLNLEGKSLKGWIHKDSESTLFDFLGWFSIVMPRMFRFEPILPRYLLRNKDTIILDLANLKDEDEKLKSNLDPRQISK